MQPNSPIRKAAAILVGIVVLGTALAVSYFHAPTLFAIALIIVCAAVILESMGLATGIITGRGAPFSLFKLRKRPPKP